MIGNFAAKETSFKANLKDGREVELFLRPFSLSDLAWVQDKFPSEQDQFDIISMKVVPCAKLIWRLLDEDSKKIFMSMTFLKIDDNGNKVEAKPEGYERFVEALESGAKGMQSLIDGFAAYSENLEKNGFIPDTSKKKIQKIKK